MDLPGRSPHQALDALVMAILRRKVNWVLDADIRAFFDTLEHGWLVKFIEHRVADRRVVRLIQKWLKAGVLEDGKRMQSELGTVQGGSISPLLANIYLHYVLDLWVRQWRKKQARGEVVVVRFADDFVVGFEQGRMGSGFGRAKERLARFGLELRSEKTRLIECGRGAEKDRQSRGEGKLERTSWDLLTAALDAQGKVHGLGGQYARGGRRSLGRLRPSFIGVCMIPSLMGTYSRGCSRPYALLCGADECRVGQ